LIYLHSRSPPVIHGDLHDRNILITAAGDALICDFGLSRIRHEVTRTHTTIRQGGRVRFVSPELSRGPDHFRSNEASDIYSLAMTIYSLGVGKKPLWNTELDKKAAKLAEQGMRPGFGIDSMDDLETFGGLGAAPSWILWTLLRQMWKHEPTERIAVSAVRDHL
ncbi:kinase-like protein, partial [Clavulina sp. PMI_390]